MAQHENKPTSGLNLDNFRKSHCSEHFNHVDVFTEDVPLHHTFTDR